MKLASDEERKIIMVESSKFPKGTEMPGGKCVMKRLSTTKMVVKVWPENDDEIHRYLLCEVSGSALASTGISLCEMSDRTVVSTGKLMSLEEVREFSSMN